MKFQKACEHNGVITMVETECFPAFVRFGYTWVVHKEVNEIPEGSGGPFTSWEISEKSTGFRLPFMWPMSRKAQAILYGKKYLRDKGEEMTRQVIEGAKAMLKSSGIEYEKKVVKQ